ncbi:hypothetical protein V502_01707 [Pseudogymnoascus sp. VKM F-4520 (FW-2644)]|nr:hypothetical protein V502_01707 [Pseudogymnoascus sp. VKM F-4520 (FW-2644)]
MSYRGKQLTRMVLQAVVSNPIQPEMHNELLWQAANTCGAAGTNLYGAAVSNTCGAVGTTNTCGAAASNTCGAVGTTNTCGAAALSDATGITVAYL